MEGLDDVEQQTAQEGTCKCSIISNDSAIKIGEETDLANM
jgi:hypothetical protein